MAYFRCEIGTGSGEIKNATTAEYKAYDVDIESGNFVELTQKQSDETEVNTTVYTIPIDYHSSCQQNNDNYTRMELSVDDVYQIDSNNFLLAIGQKIEYWNGSAGSSRYEYYYVYFKKVTLNNDGTITAINSGSQIRGGSIGKIAVKPNGAANTWYYITNYATNNNYTYYAGDENYLNKNFNSVLATITFSASLSVTSNEKNVTANEIRVFKEENTLAMEKDWVVANNSDTFYFTYIEYDDSDTTYNIGFMSRSDSSVYHDKFATPEAAFVIKEWVQGKGVYKSGIFGNSTVTNGWYASATTSSPTTTQSTYWLDSNGCRGKYESATKKFILYEDSAGATVKNQYILSGIPDGSIVYVFEKNYCAINSDNILQIKVRDSNQNYTIQYYKLNPANNTATYIDSYSPTVIYSNQTYIGKDLYSWNAYNAKIFKSNINIILEDVIKPAETKIDGVTKTKCTSSTAGSVYVLNSNS